MRSLSCWSQSQWGHRRRPTFEDARGFGVGGFDTVCGGDARGLIPGAPLLHIDLHIDLLRNRSWVFVTYSAWDCGGLNRRLEAASALQVSLQAKEIRKTRRKTIARKQNSIQMKLKLPTKFVSHPALSGVGSVGLPARSSLKTHHLTPTPQAWRKPQPRAAN
jgi:hypothetical protein